MAIRSGLNVLKKLAVLLLSLGWHTALFANPVLNNVAAGNVVVNQSGSVTQINQSSSRAILNWHSFNIKSSEATRFVQPKGGVALNRIDPGQGPSQIFGQLTATGKIILVNQAGIYFGPSARVDVGGIIASTSDISDKNFLAGKYSFDQPSAFAGSIINEGTIIAARHGLVALIGTSVQNDGTIRANLGNVVLASGNKFTVDLSGDQLVNFTIDEATSNAGIDQNGNALKNGVSNRGNIIANGGIVILSARTAAGILDNAINMSGVIQADSVAKKNGQIILSGGENGIVDVSGTLQAAGKKTGTTGGDVKIAGQYILLDSGARIDVSGDSGGGNALIGGNRQGSTLYSFDGKTILPAATATVVAPTATILADAITSGNGGNVIVWSDGVTKAYGILSAQGGSTAGNGGFIETSGHYLDIKGIQVNTSAAKGNKGEWLLDPYDITISASATTNGSFDGLNPDTFTPNATGSNVDTADLVANLAASDVTINTSGGGGSETGNITITDGFDFSGTGQTLTLNADGSIFVNAGVNIHVFDNTFVLNAANGGISIANNAYIQGNNGGFGFSQGTLTMTAATSINVDGQIGFGPGAFDFNPLFNVTLNAPTTNIGAAGSVQSRNQTYNSAITGTFPASAIYMNGGDLTLNGTIDGSGSPFDIFAGTINNLFINGAVGGNTPLTTFNLPNVAFMNAIVIGAGITTTGNQSYGYATQINGTQTLTSSGGNITFSSTLDGASGTDSLTANAASGTVQFVGAVGTTTPLDSLTTNASNTLVQVDMTTNNNQTYNGLVTIDNSRNFTSNNGNIDFAGGISGNSFDVALNGVGVTLDGTVDVNNLTVTGAGLSNTLTLPSGNKEWDLTGFNDGSIVGFSSVAGAFNFSNFQNLTGGSGNDDYAFLGGGIAGNLTGGIGGVQTLDYSNYGGIPNIDLQNASTPSVDGVFSNITRVIGDNTLFGIITGLDSTSSWTITGTNTGTVTGLADGFSNINDFEGGSGTNTLTGMNTSNTWTISGANSGSVGSISFNNMQNLVGNASSDTFVFQPGSSVSSINGGSNGTLDYSGYGSAVNVNVQTGVATGVGNFSNMLTFIGDNTFFGTLTGPNTTTAWILTGTNFGSFTGITGFINFDNLVGGSGTNTLTGMNAANIWTIAGSNSGSVTGLSSFSNMQNLVGNVNDDSFNIQPGGSVSSVNGGSAGVNTLSYIAYASPMSVNLQTGVATAVGSFSNINSVQGADTGSDTLTAANTSNTWAVSGTGAGTVTGLTNGFNGFANLVGGSGADNFVFTAAGGATSINGSSGTNTLDFSSYPTFSKLSFTADGAGSAIDNGSATLFTFSNFFNGAGNNAANLTTPGAALELPTGVTNTLTLNADGSGSFSDPFSFNGFNAFHGNGSDIATFSGFTPTITQVNATDFTVTTNGTTYYFYGFTTSTPVPPVPPTPPTPVPSDVNSVVISATTTNNSSNSGIQLMAPTVVSNFIYQTTTINQMLTQMMQDLDAQQKITLNIGCIP